MNDISLWGLFFSAFLSSTLLPGGSEAVLAVLTSQQAHPLGWLLTIAAAGNTLGGMTSWGIGRIIAIRYPAEQVVSPRQSPPANHSDEGRGARDEEDQNSFDRGIGRSGCAAMEPGQSRDLSRQRRSYSLAGKPEIPRPSPLVTRPSAKDVARLRRWGAPVLLLSWLPVIGDPLCVAAGWLRMHWLLSLILIGIGKTARYLVVIYLFS